MTARHMIQVDADYLEQLAWRTHAPIERSATEECVYLTLGGITYWAPSPNEVTC